MHYAGWPLCTVAAILTVGLDSRSALQEVKVSYHVTPSITVHEPVFLKLSFENGLANPVEIDLGLNSLGSLFMSVTSPTGAMVSADPSRVTRPEGRFEMTKKTLNVGEQYSQQVLLNDWFTFDNVGEYRFEVTFRGSVRTATGEKLAIPSRATSVIRVLPRYEDRLREVCETFLNETRQTQNSDAARDAARALAAVNDPVAVEHLRAAIKSEIFVADVAIAALQRLGTPEAVHVLKETTTDRRRTVVELAEQALAAIRANRRAPQ
jgi:hypothetical protein